MHWARTRDSGTCTWLPDAEMDAHPLGTWLLQMGFELWIGACYRRVVLRTDDGLVRPAALIACNHQRDIDGPMLGTVLIQRHGLHFLQPLPYYATREDLFRPGILARLTVDWPGALSALLGRISLAWFFPLGRAEPILRVREFTLGETLRALMDAGFGDTGCATLLNARGQRELGTHAAGSIARAATSAPIAVLEQRWGLRRLQGAAFAALAPGFRAAIEAQLAHFARHLQQGHAVYFAPEGTLSTDGHFGRIRAGCFRLVHTTRPNPWIQPVALAYDCLGPGRARAVVQVGSRFRADSALDRRAFDATLRSRILDLVPVTASHLVAYYLLRGPATFTRTEFIQWLARSIAVLRIRHASLDPLLTTQGAAKLAAARLRWLARKQLVQRRGNAFSNRCPRDVSPKWATPAASARWLDNQLADLLANAECTLPC